MPGAGYEVCRERKTRRHDDEDENEDAVGKEESGRGEVVRGGDIYHSSIMCHVSFYMDLLPTYI